MTQLNRRDVLKYASTAGVIGISTQTATAKPNLYPRVEDLGPYEGKSISKFASGAQKHPSQDRFAIVTAAFGHGLQLYVGDGATSLEESPDELYQITSGSHTGVFQLEWKHGNRIEYVIDFTKYQRKIPPSYKILPHQLEKENVLTDDNERVESGGGN